MSDLIKDDRFKKVHYDPKFQNFNKKKTKTKIEDRFKGVFTDDRFKIVGKTDKYGRELVASETNKEMDDYYIQSSENENEKEEEEEQQQSESENNQEQKQQKKKNQKKNKKNKNKKQKKLEEDEEDEQEENNNKNQKEKLKDPFAGGFQWDEESSTDEEISEIVEEENEVWEKDMKSNVKYGEDTSSILALQNYDWMNVSAKDLMVLFSSFCNQVGYIKNIVVYPSKFGKEKLAEEQEFGPRGLWKDEQEVQKIVSKKKKPVRSLTNQIIVNEDDKDNDIDINALRIYEKQRLQYYYAVIYCDSVKTAVHIYENCNEQEFEFSSLALDLRFVPEDIQFPFEAKEKCNKMPPISQVKSFNNRSQGHTKVKLTWDEPQNDKFKFLEGKDLNDEDLDKIDWDQYVGDMASESSSDEDESNSQNQEEEDEDEEQQQKEKEEKKLTDWRQNFNKKGKKKQQEDDIEITFASGFGDIKKNIEKRKKILDAEEAESGWEKYLRQKKEKKNAKRLAKKQMKENDEDYFIDPSESKNDKKLKKKQQQELEMLIDEEQVKREQDFNVNVEDERFAKVYTNPQYSLDPTHKNFKKEQNSKFLQEQQKKRRQQKKLNENDSDNENQQEKTSKKIKIL